MRGNITRRGERSWRLKFDVPTPNGRRETRYVTVRGTKQQAQFELHKLLNSIASSTFVEPSRLTLTEYLRAWIDGCQDLAGKTAERYRSLIEQQIIPHLGAAPLQKLRPSMVKDWHGKLLREGGKGGAPLSAQTVQHAHRVLHTALAAAVTHEQLSRNVATHVRPPKVRDREIESLTSDQINTVIEALDGHPLKTIGILALSSGARRGELLGLSWGLIDLDRGLMRIERSLEQTRAGLKFKTPKTKRSRRTVSLPAMAIDALREHRKHQLEIRLALAMGKPDADTLVFSTVEGNPVPPNNLSRDWARFMRFKKLPPVSFHGLRHSHVSALIAKGVDVLTVSRRIGHASPVVTLRVYAHMFEKSDSAAASAIEAALKQGGSGK